MKWTWYKILAGNETLERAKALGIINGIIAILLGLVFFSLHWLLGFFIIIMAIICFIGVGLIDSGKYGTATILIGISGVIIIPIGIIGIIGAMIVWKYSDRYKNKIKKKRDKHRHERRETRKRMRK